MNKSMKAKGMNNKGWHNESMRHSNAKKFGSAGGSSKKVNDLFQHFKDEDLLEDRREYNVGEYMGSYPELSEKEAKKLHNKVQKWVKEYET